MIIFLLLLFFVDGYCGIISNKDICKNIDCDDTTPVCGIRQEGENYRLKEFKNECLLLENGCLADDEEAYGIINMEYCKKAFQTNLKQENFEISCAEIECPLDDDTEICAMRTEDDGVRIRIFDNKCHVLKYNCENGTDFVETDSYLCNGMNDNTEEPLSDFSTTEEPLSNFSTTEEPLSNFSTTEEPLSNFNNTEEPDNIVEEEFPPKNVIRKFNNIVVVDKLLNYGNIKNVNESIDNFFAASHVFDLPMKEVTEDFSDLNNMSGRRMRLRNAGHVMIFEPLIKIPKNTSTDIWHIPTLSSCYHKCPTKCPDTYSPVCGYPGIGSRAPHVTFQNHCFMDAAQCKWSWEDMKAAEPLTASYMETTFIFCLGDEMNAMYRFLPLIRTLQHMGRLKKKGYYRYKLTNLKFFNNLLKGNPRYQG